MIHIKNKNLFLLLLGRIVSDLGSSIQMLIIPLYIIDIGGTSADIGLFSFSYLIPILIIFPFAGVIGDKLNRKRIMVLCDYISGGVALILAILSIMGMMNFTILIICQMLIGICYGFFDPASKGMLPQLVEKEELASANSKVASFRIISSLVAPVIGAFLYLWLGITILFIINGLSFIFSAISEMFIKYAHKKSDEKIHIKSILADLKQGFKFIVDKKVILKLCIYFLVIYTFIQPIFSIVLPLLFRTKLSFSDSYYGYIQTVFVAGMLVGSILIGVTSKKMGLKKSFALGNLGLAFSMIAFALIMLPNFISFLGSGAFIYFVSLSLCLLVLSASMMFANIPIQTFIQKVTPPDYMSRVFSIVGMISKGGAPLGGLIFGYILVGASLHWTVLAISIILLVTIIMFMQLLNKDLNKLEESSDGM